MNKAIIEQAVDDRRWYSSSSGGGT